MRVMVVDDHAFTRTTVAGSLRMLGIDVVLESETVLSAVQGASELQPDAAVIDMNLGAGPTGIDLAHGLRRKHPEMGIVILTSYSDPRLMSADLPELPPGASYLVKQELVDTALLVQALNDSVLAARNTRKKGPMQIARVDLTDGQTEVFRLMAEGLSNGEIARRRNVQEKAVEQTVSRIAKKLGVTSDSSTNLRAQIIKRYFELTGMQSGR